MGFAEENCAYMKHAYLVDMKTTGQIAKELSETKGVKIDPLRVQRALKKLGVKLRQGSEACKVAYKNGVVKLPRNHMNDGVRKKISESRSKAWQNCSSTEIEVIKDRAKLRWSLMTESQKKEMRDASVRGIRKAAKNGSALEIYLHEELIKAGYDCYHHKRIIENEKLEVDLVIPSIRLVVEIDGPSHSLPIYGEENLEKVMRADKEKNGLLVQNKFSVLRLRCLKKSVSDKVKRDCLNLILDSIKQLSVKNDYSVTYVEI